jgi:prepilin-type N-terminal cleavage/methylation domain-containing protein
MKSVKCESGFTLTELLICVAVIGIVFSSGCVQNYLKAREKAREAETKSNIHSIQIGLERYAVDSGGTYPLILYGGDKTDSFTTRKTADYTDSSGNIKPGRSEFKGDIDVLLEFGYLSQYPSNPFQRMRDVNKYGRLITQPSQYNLPQLNYRVNIWSDHPETVNGNPDRAQQLVERVVGGVYSDLMWDISEGQRHSPFPIIVVPDPDPNAPENYYHYVNPGVRANISKVADFYDDHLFFLQPGNFYYYAVFNVPGGYSGFVNGNLNSPVVMEVTGFNLAGYGDIRNPGNDVYNIFGDYYDRSLFTCNNPEDEPLILKTIPSPTEKKAQAGPDGRPDGVIIVVQSGADRKLDEELTRLLKDSKIMHGIDSNASDSGSTTESGEM